MWLYNSGREQTDHPTATFRLRTPSPDSPRYYESSLTKVSVPFPTLVGDSVPLTLAGLPEYIRNFNKTSAPSKLNIWVPTRAEMGKPQDPVTVRLVLPDILVAYCVLSTPTGRSGLSVETVTVSGPREQVLNTLSLRPVATPNLIVCSPDQATLPIGVHCLPKSVPTDRKDGPNISTGVVPTADGKNRAGRSQFSPLISLPLYTEPLVVIRKSLRHELFALLADIVVGSAHSACCASVGRGRWRRGKMGFSTRYLSSGVGYFGDKGD